MTRVQGTQAKGLGCWCRAALDKEAKLWRAVNTKQKSMDISMWAVLPLNVSRGNIPFHPLWRADMFLQFKYPLNSLEWRMFGKYDAQIRTKLLIIKGEQTFTSQCGN